MANNAVHAADINAHLTTKGLPPKTSWTNTFLSTQRANIPLQSLKETAFWRLTQTDITNTLSTSPHHILPNNVLDATIKERKLQGPVAVQILDIEDMGRSRWSQVEAIEADERGETTRGREIIRVVPNEESSDADRENVTSATSNGPHKLLVQDAAGQRVYGIELKAVSGVSMNMNIGSKLVLRHAIVARGVLLLEPCNTTVLGGKLEAHHTAWKSGLKAKLQNAANEASEAG